MKKSTKSIKPAAPQTKSIVPKPVGAKPVKKAAAPRKKPAAKPLAPASRPLAGSTTIIAQIDIGFGNVLFVRGEGPGLSWDQGRAMDCVSDDQWSLTLPAGSSPVVFKFLVNDLTWSTGSDYVIDPGTKIVLTPGF